MYIHHFLKIQVNFANVLFCTEEVLVGVTSVINESHLSFLDPISRVIFRNYALTLCNGIYPKVFELGNGSWMSYAKPLKLILTPNRIKTTGENYERFSSHNLAAKGLLTNLRDSKLSKVMKHSRKTITGREVFLEQIKKYSYDQLGQFRLNFRPYS